MTCGCGVEAHPRPTEAEAIAAWNTRTETGVLPDLLAALVAILPFADDMTETGQQAIADAAAAIAKARGAA